MEKHTDAKIMNVRLYRFTHQLCTFRADLFKAIPESFLIFTSHEKSLTSPDNYTCQP